MFLSPCIHCVLRLARLAEVPALELVLPEDVVEDVEEEVAGQDQQHDVRHRLLGVPKLGVGDVGGVREVEGAEGGGEGEAAGVADAQTLENKENSL